MTHPESIFSYITTEEASFQTDEIDLGENWRWNFLKHVQLIFHLKNGIFFTGENNWLRAFKNIMEPLLNLSYWAEDIEVKDVLFFIESEIGHIQSFLIKKYHDEVYVKENNLDTFFDEITEDDLDYGGVLVQKTNKGRPEILFLNSIAFCDQTDIMGGPIAFKHSFSPDKLRDMSKNGWGDEKNGATISIQDLITLATVEKEVAGLANQKKNRTTGKNIDIYILRGSLPEHYLLDNDNFEDYYNQLQIVAFYTNKKNEKEGVVLYRKKEDKGNLKFHTCKKIYGRALGRGVGEGLLHQQIWTNFLEIHKMNMLEAGSKNFLYTDDPAFGTRNKIMDMENNELATIEDGKVIRKVPMPDATSIQLFEQSINTWYEHAQLTSSAFDAMLGKNPHAGTAFRTQGIVVQQGRGLHDLRRGKRAKFFEEIYRDWIIPNMVKGILNGKTFLSTLTSEEMGWITKRLAENYASVQRDEDVLNGVIPRDADMLKQQFTTEFQKKGNKHILEILKGEFKDVEIKMGINIAGKQKNITEMSDKILSIFQFIFANAQGFQQIMQIPGMQKAFDDILEYSGISPIEFSAMASMNFQPQQPQIAPGQQPPTKVPPQMSKLPVTMQHA